LLSVPEEFLCPITCDIMRQPVRCGDGFVYEEAAIKGGKSNFFSIFLFRNEMVISEIKFQFKIFLIKLLYEGPSLYYFGDTWNR
jgi:hypothetical protein